MIVGPHTFNAPDIAAQLIDAGAAVQVESDQAVEEILLEWFRNPALIAAMGRAGFEQVQKGQGAVSRTLDVSESALTVAAG